MFLQFCSSEVKIAKSLEDGDVEGEAGEEERDYAEDVLETHV